MNEERDQRYRHANVALASLKKRGLAFFIDELLLSMLFLIALYDQIAGLQDAEAMLAIINNYSFEYLLIKVLYQTLFVFIYSATIGKIVMKIQVVDVDEGARPIFSSALNRGVFRVISEMIFYIGFVWAYYNKERQTWHDKTARTLVVDV